MTNPEENKVAEQPINELKTLLEAEQRGRAAAEAEVAKREVTITELNATIGEAKQSLANTVAAYKALVVRSNPGIPPELIAGDTFEAIDRSLESAGGLIAKVKQSLEAEIASGKVPAGAPPRTTPDLESLSPREKIQLALAKR